MLAVAMLILITIASSRLRKINIASSCAQVFASAKSTYVLKNELPTDGNSIARVRDIIRNGYAHNCSIESVMGKYISRQPWLPAYYIT